MSDSVRPHRRQPTRLLHPWDSPDKNNGVGRRFLLQCMKVKRESEVTQSCPTLSDPMDCSLPGFSMQEYWSGVPLPSPELSLSTAFIVFHRFWVVVSSFSFIFMHILIAFFISSVICWLFSSVLFSLHMLEFLIVFLL